MSNPILSFNALFIFSIFDSPSSVVSIFSINSLTRASVFILNSCLISVETELESQFINSPSALVFVTLKSSERFLIAGI